MNADLEILMTSPENLTKLINDIFKPIPRDFKSLEESFLFYFNHHP